MTLHSSLAIVVLCCGTSLAETMSTVAGTGAAENNGDSGKGVLINIKDPFGVEIGPQGDLYVTEVGHHRVRRLNRTSGEITTVAGTGTKGYSGDGKQAIHATLNEPYEIRFDQAGNMYFVEMQNHVIRKVDVASGVISTLAGTGQMGFGGDGGPATEAQFSRPHSIALDGKGGLYVADIGNHRIRRIDLSTNSIETIAGTGAKELPANGAIAKGRPILGPRALYVQGDTMWIALREGHSVWRLELNKGTLHHVAGTGKKGDQDGGPKQATFNGPKGIVVDSRENVFVVDTENQKIRKIDGTTGLVSTVVGCGRRGAGGDGGDPLHAEMARPHGICLDSNGAIFIGDTLNHRVRMVAP